MSSKASATSAPATPHHAGAHPTDLAPRWHTAALVALILAVALVGTLLTYGDAPRAASAASGSMAAVYAPLLVVQGGLLFYVVRIGRKRSALRSLLGTGWASIRRATLDLALASAAALWIIGLETTWSTICGVRHESAARALQPHTPSEIAMWLAVATSVGFSEEIVYRGYLQTQLAACARSPWVGCVVSALLFGVAHAEQGLAAAARIAFYGLTLGLLARRRRSLVPGILAHVAIDMAAGLLAR